MTVRGVLSSWTTTTRELVRREAASLMRRSLDAVGRRRPTTRAAVPPGFTASATILRRNRPALNVGDICVETRDGDTALCATVKSERDGLAFDLRYIFEGLPPSSISRRGDTFVPALLLPAMVRGESLRIAGPVSPRLRIGAEQAMDVFRAWRRTFWIEGDMRRIVLDAVTTPAPAEGQGVGLFFSCGVDSFYSLVKNEDQHDPRHPGAVSHLVLVQGFDVELTNAALFERMRAVAAHTARETGRQLIVVRDNVREFSDRFVPWALYHGGALSSLALAMSPVFRRCLIASTHAYGELVPWGSHPLLDALWSTEGLEFVHDGCEALRTEKIRRLATSDLALRGLRVCWAKDNTTYNCGQCEKCLRTMIGLEVAGALHRCTTFDRPLHASAIRRLKVDPGESSERFLEDLVLALEDAPEHNDIRRALQHVMAKAKWRRRLGVLARRAFGDRATLRGIRETIGVRAADRHGYMRLSLTPPGPSRRARTVKG